MLNNLRDLNQEKEQAMLLAVLILPTVLKTRCTRMTEMQE